METRHILCSQGVAAMRGSVRLARGLSAADTMAVAREIKNACGGAACGVYLRFGAWRFVATEALTYELLDKLKALGSSVVGVFADKEPPPRKPVPKAAGAPIGKPGAAARPTGWTPEMLQPAESKAPTGDAALPAAGTAAAAAAAAVKKQDMTASMRRAKPEHDNTNVRYVRVNFDALPIVWIAIARALDARLEVGSANCRQAIMAFEPGKGEGAEGKKVCVGDRGMAYVCEPAAARSGPK